VRGAPDRDEAELVRQHDLVKALLAALRTGDVEAIVAALAPDVVIHASGPDGQVRDLGGARNWAKSAVGFSRTTRGAVEPALVEGAVGVIYAPNGRLARVLRFTFTRGAITRVDIIGDAARVKTLEIGALS
jgi:hypothetical protein